MANRDNIAFLSKYQMRILYYKCKEGATHAEIAALLDRDVNTVQYHMTKIYTTLEIRRPGKSKEEMESELKNEICPIIRSMFNTYDEVKIWAPVVRDRSQEERENLDESMDEPVPEASQPPYQPPPSVARILNSAEFPPRPPEIVGPPPPGRRRRNWWLIIGGIVAGLLIIFFLVIYPTMDAPAQPIPTETASSLRPTDAPTWTPEPTLTSVPAEEMVSPDQMMLVFIPAGEFKMGSSRADDPQAFDEELPQHIVYLGDFWIDKTEVTNAQYAMCVASGNCTPPANNYSSTRESYYNNSQYADYPVVFVSWSQAAAYCSWAGRRLPTEAEWEKAARGSDGRVYPWGNTFDGTLANSCDANCNLPWKGQYDDGYVETAPVGAYPNGASVYGILDMAGNVYEWVADWYDPYNPDRQENPTGPNSGLDKIMRGGSWGDDPAHVRTTIRSPINPDNWLDFIGFRCAR